MNAFSYSRNNIKRNFIGKKNQINFTNNYRINENIVSKNVLSEINLKSISLSKCGDQNNCFLPINFTVKEKFIYLEINEKKLLNKIKEQIMSLSGKCVTDLDTTETSNLTVSLIVTDHSKIIKNITKQERSIYLPSSLLKIKNFNNIPICPAHYFHSFLTTELMKKRQEICKPPISSNIIFLTSNFIKIQQRQNIERIKFCQKDTIDGFVKLNVFNNFLVSAFTKKTSKSLKHNMKKKSLKYEGYCEFCRIQTVNRFIHCDDKYHKYRINLNKKLFEELDREVGFFDDNFKNDLLYQFEK